MDKKEQVFKDVTDRINKCVNDTIVETIQDAIYEVYPMTKVECSYKNALHLLIVRIRYFCYGKSLELNIKYTDITAPEVQSYEFVDTLIDRIGDAIGQKIAMINNERRDEDE